MVLVEDVLGAVVGDVDVGVAVAVVVGKRYTEAAALEGDAGRVADVDVAAIVVAVEDVADRCVGRGLAVGAGLADLTDDIDVEAVVDVVGDKEVEVAVAVVVEEAGAGAPARVGDARVHRGEDATVVAVEGVGTVVGDVEIRIAVGVVVGGCYPESVPRVGCTAPGGGIGETATSVVVAVEAVDWQWVGGQAGQITAVDQVEIEIVVGVVVEEGGAGAKGFDIKIFSRKAVIVREVEPCVRRSVAEVDGFGFGSGLGRAAAQQCQNSKPA